MQQVERFAIICITLAGLFLPGAQTIAVTSQPSETLKPRFNSAFALVHQAETAGATREEVASLVLLLNKALQLDVEAEGLPAPEAWRKPELLARVDETLVQVETEAGQLEVVAAQRTFTSRVFAYVSGGVAALVSTLSYVLGVRFWRMYWIKRTFQMRVFRK